MYTFCWVLLPCTYTPTLEYSAAPAVHFATAIRYTAVSIWHVPHRVDRAVCIVDTIGVVIYLLHTLHAFR